MEIGSVRSSKLGDGPSMMSRSMRAMAHRAALRSTPGSAPWRPRGALRDVGCRRAAETIEAARNRDRRRALVWPITVSPAPSINSRPRRSPRRAGRRPAPHLGAEIEQDVAAQDDVEPARMRRRLDQAVHLEADRSRSGSGSASRRRISSNQRIICMTGRPRWTSNWE